MMGGSGQRWDGNGLASAAPAAAWPFDETSQEADRSSDEIIQIIASTQLAER